MLLLTLKSVDSTGQLRVWVAVILANKVAIIGRLCLIAVWCTGGLNVIKPRLQYRLTESMQPKNKTHSGQRASETCHGKCNNAVALQLNSIDCDKTKATYCGGVHFACTICSRKDTLARFLFALCFSRVQ